MRCVGSLFLLFIAGTLASILTAAHPAHRHPRKWATLAIIAALLLICVTASQLSWLVCGETLAVFLAWCTFAGVTSAALSRVMDIRAGVPVTLAIFMFLFAAPVTAMPLVRLAATRGGKWETFATQAVGYAAPVVSVLNASADSISIGGGGPAGWTELPLLYHLTAIGQDIAAPSVTWWQACLAYALAAILIACIWRLTSMLRTKRHPPPPLP